MKTPDKKARRKIHQKNHGRSYCGVPEQQWRKKTQRNGMKTNESISTLTAQ